MSGSSADRGGVDAFVPRLLTPRRRRLRHLLPRQPHPFRDMLGPFECHQIGPSKRLSEIRLHAISLFPGTIARWHLHPLWVQWSGRDSGLQKLYESYTEPPRKPYGRPWRFRGTRPWKGRGGLVEVRRQRI
jgi:hypothetical protein